MPKKLTAKQVKALRRSLDREGKADIRVGECRVVSRHQTKICRTSKSVYKLVDSWHQRGRARKAPRSRRLSMYYAG